MKCNLPLTEIEIFATISNYFKVIDSPFTKNVENIQKTRNVVGGKYVLIVNPNKILV